MSKCVDVSKKLNKKIKKLCEETKIGKRDITPLVSSIQVPDTIYIKIFYKKYGVPGKKEPVYSPSEISFDSSSTKGFNNYEAGKHVIDLNAQYKEIAKNIKKIGLKQLKSDLQSIKSDLEKAQNNLKELNISNNSVKNNIAKTIESLNSSLAVVNKSIK